MEKVIDIPEGVTVEKQGNVIAVKGPKGLIEKKLSNPEVAIKISDNVTITSKTERRKTLALTGTFNSHIKNMILGVTKGFEAKMKIIYSHFPMKLKVEGNKLVIQNFMGGRSLREIEIIDGVEVKTTKDDVIVSGINKESVGQTVGRIEQTTKVVGFDRRVFQDGIHLTQKTAPVKSKDN